MCASYTPFPPDPVPPLDPRNPVAQALAKRQRWSYFHTHRVDAALVSRAVAEKRSIEFDIWAEDWIVAIQHPPSFYKSRGEAPPFNIDLEDAVRLVEGGDDGCVVVLDAKSSAALACVNVLVARLGTHRCVVHAFCRELAFPRPAAVAHQAHWDDEDQPLEAVLRASWHGDTRAAVAVTCRHVTPERLDDPDLRVVDKCAHWLPGKADVVGLWLPRGVAPPKSVAARLLEAGVLVSFNADAEVKGAAALPAPCVCMTDHLDRASEHA